MTNPQSQFEQHLSKKVARKIWWLKHSRNILLTIVSLAGAAIFSWYFAALLSV